MIVSTGGGREVVWGPDGSELYYRNDDQLMVVPVNTGETFSAETPAPLLATPYDFDNPAGANPNYDISPDGEEFIFAQADLTGDGGSVPQIQVVLNWFQELIERVPVP